MTAQLTGGCLCGAVRYSINAEPVETGFCHCHSCQRSAGAPVIAWANFPRDAFSYTTGQAGTFASSEKAVREYCRDCGTQLVFRSHINTSTIDITVNSLDEPGRFPPEYHIWFDERVAWIDYDDGLPRYAGDAPDD